MDHLSGVDATFLYTETPETPMHVGSLNVYELPPGYEGHFVEDVRRHLAGRLHLAPVFRRKLLNMPFELANPIWVSDDDLDLEYHIRDTVLPKPGSRAQLDKLVGRLHSSQLDRSRPLWEVYVIEGLQSPPDAPAGTRHVGFYTKVHHASLDGAGGVALAAAMTDLTPIARKVPAEKHRRAPKADTYGIAELSMAGLSHMVGQYVKLGRALPTLARTIVQLLRPTRAPAADADSHDAPAHWFGPRTPLNVNITNQRAFASLSIPFAEARQVAKANDVTINDVVMAICSGALRRYLADLDALPAQPLLAGVPVSLREAGNTEMNTQASMMRVSLASNVADPVERLQAIHRASAAAKALTSTVKAILPTDFPSLGAPWLISGLAALYGRSRLGGRIPPVVNVIISNVPGPAVPLYLAGARMLSYHPLNIPAHGVALNITVESYNGSLDFGLVACRKAVPDVADLARHMRAAHLELLSRSNEPAATLPAPAPAPKAARRKVAAPKGVGARARSAPGKPAPAAATRAGRRTATAPAAPTTLPKAAGVR
jgi:diacylglycerol O-acyltransferase